MRSLRRHPPEYSPARLFLFPSPARELSTDPPISASAADRLDCQGENWLRPMPRTERSAPPSARGHSKTFQVLFPQTTAAWSDSAPQPEWQPSTVACLRNFRTPSAQFRHRGDRPGNAPGEWAGRPGKTLGLLRERQSDDRSAENWPETPET